MPSRYYLNDFPEPFVVNGKPDFAVIFGIDSRRWLEMEGPPRTARDRNDLTFADVTDAVNFMNLSFLLGSAGFHESPQDCVFVENWLSHHDLIEIRKRNLILVGSGKVNSLWRSYEEDPGKILTLTFKYEKDIPQAIVYKGEEIYKSADEEGGVGFVQIASSPHSEEKVILFIAGFHGKGTSGACLALAKRLKDINDSNVVACITKPVRTRLLGAVFDDAEILRVIASEERVEDKEHLKQLLEIYEENRKKLEKQIAWSGGDVEASLELLNRMDLTVEQIERINRKLKDP